MKLRRPYDVLIASEARYQAEGASQVIQMDQLRPYIEKIDPSTFQMYHGEEVDVAA